MSKGFKSQVFLPEPWWSLIASGIKTHHVIWSDDPIAAGETILFLLKTTEEAAPIVGVVTTVGAFFDPTAALQAGTLDKVYPNIEHIDAAIALVKDHGAVPLNKEAKFYLVGFQLSQGPGLYFAR